MSSVHRWCRDGNRRSSVALMPVTMVGTAIMVTGYSSEIDMSRPNVLFIAVDDLRTALHCYDTRAPLILCAPGFGSGMSAALVEFVDIYPTLLELCGLPPREGLEGISLMPLLQQPDRPWKSAAFSQFPRPWTYRGEPEVMGYTMRTARYRYIEWVRFRTHESLACELYDHESDAAEVCNLAGDAGHAAIIAQLGHQLRAGWRGALPPVDVRGS